MPDQSPPYTHLMEEWLKLCQNGFTAVWEGYTQWWQNTLLEGPGQLGLGQTAAHEIWRQDRVRLIRYQATTRQQYALPILCVPSLINRHYIFDLLPERSLVAYLVSQGFNVYLLDWGRPSLADRELSLDEHLTNYLYGAVEAVSADSQALGGSERVTLLGYCMGGMFAAVYTTLYGRHVANLINLAGPINYHDEGIFSFITRTEWFDVDHLVDNYGNIPAELLNMTFQMLRPTSHLLRALHLYERMDDPQYVRSFAAIQTWVFDQVDFPGEAFRRYIKAFYQSNQLVRDQLKIEGQRILLERIQCPLLTITSQDDETAPWESVAVLNERAGSRDKTVLLLKGPHVGMVAGSRAPKQLWPQLSKWLVAHSGRQYS